MRPRFWLGFALVAAIAIGSIAIALLVHERERDSFERTQRSEATRAAHQAEALARLSIGQLASAAAFYRAEARFTQHEFDVIAGSLLNSGALTATAFIRSVPGPARARFERHQGYPILERGPLGDLRRAGRRSTYFPLAFAATGGLNVGLPHGYDVGSDLLRGSYLFRARDSGHPAATPVMRLPVGGTGINVFRPVYRDGAPIRTVVERRAALIGFAAGAFRLPELPRRRHRRCPTGSTPPWWSVADPSSAPTCPARKQPPRRSGSPIAPGSWSCATRAGPASTWR